MSPQQFLLFNVIFVIILLVLYLRTRRGSAPPSKLKMSGESSNSLNNGLRDVTPNTQLSIEVGLTQILDHEGKSCDAYQVLGINRSASIGEIKASYEELFKRALPGQKTTLERALRVVLSVKNRPFS